MTKEADWETEFRLSTKFFEESCINDWERKNTVLQLYYKKISKYYKEAKDENTYLYKNDGCCDYGF